MKAGAKSVWMWNEFRGIAQCLNPLYKCPVVAAALDSIDITGYSSGLVRLLLRKHFQKRDLSWEGWKVKALLH